MTFDDWFDDTDMGQYDEETARAAWRAACTAAAEIAFGFAANTVAEEILAMRETA